MPLVAGYFRESGWFFDVPLDMMHHGHGSNQDDGCNDLVRVKAGMEQTPGDAYGSERLDHLKITRG